MAGQLIDLHDRVERAGDEAAVFALAVTFAPAGLLGMTIGAIELPGNAGGTAPLPAERSEGRPVMNGAKRRS